MQGPINSNSINRINVHVGNLGNSLETQWSMTFPYKWLNIPSSKTLRALQRNMSMFSVILFISLSDIMKKYESGGQV